MPGLRKNTLGKNKLFGYQKERVVKCQQVSWPEDGVKPLRPLFLYIHVKHLILTKVRTADPRVTLKFPFVSMCNKRYISKPENRENGSISGKTDSPVSLFLVPHFSG